MPVQHDQILQGDTARLHPALTAQQILDSDDKSDDAEFICCSLEFDNEIEHLSHMISHIAENFILLQRVQCDYCNYSFNDLDELKRHLPTHRRSKAICCHYCGQFIQGWWQLVQHVMYEHNIQIKRGNKSYPNNQHNKSKKKVPNHHRKRFNQKFKLKYKTETKVKTEPYTKNEPIFCSNVQNEPIFNSNINIKTEPMFVKTEPFDYF